MPVTGTHIRHDAGWRFELYAVGASAVSTTPTFSWTHDDPGPIQGEITAEYGGLGAVRGGTVQTTVDVDWAPTATHGVRYACKFWVTDADSNQDVCILSGFVRDVTGGLGSGGLYTVVVAGLGDVYLDGRTLYNIPGWMDTGGNYGGNYPASLGLGSYRAYYEAGVGALAGGDFGVRPDAQRVVGHPGAAGVTPALLAADDLHELQYNGTEPPPYVTELVAQADARFPVASASRGVPSVLTPRRVGTASTTAVEQISNRLQTTGAYNTQVTSAVGSYQRNWGLSAWVYGSIRNQPSDYDVTGLSMTRSITTSGTAPADNRVRVNYGIAVATQASSSAVGAGILANMPTANIPGLVEKADQTIELGPGQSHVMKVELSRDWLQPRQNPLYVYAYCVVGSVTSESESQDFSMVTLGPDWVAVATERVPTGAIVDPPPEYSYPFGTLGTWQAVVPGIVIPPASASVPYASQPVAAARVTYAPGQMVTAIQTGVTRWR